MEDIRKIRIGNTITIRFRLKTGGEEMPLEGRDIKVLMVNESGYAVYIPHTISGTCDIEVKIEGRNDMSIGKYFVEVWENKGKVNELVVDFDAFILVPRTMNCGCVSDENCLSVEDVSVAVGYAPSEEEPDGPEEDEPENPSEEEPEPPTEGDDEPGEDDEPGQDEPGGDADDDGDWYMLKLSETDGSYNNTAITNATREYGKVRLMPGEYPLTPSAHVYGELDLNGSKITSTEYKSASSLFSLKGDHPVLKNGEICANYDKGDNDDGYEFFEKERLVSSNGSDCDDTLLENLDLHNCWGYAIIDRTGDDITGSSTTASSAETTGTEDGEAYYKTKLFAIKPGYKYIAAYGGIGYNYIISSKEMRYTFYDADDMLLSQVEDVPRMPVAIPDGAVSVRMTTYGEKFVPYRFGYCNHKGGMTIRNCKVHHNHSLGMCGTSFGRLLVEGVESYGQRRPDDSYPMEGHVMTGTVGMIDVEDVTSPYVTLKNCHSHDEKCLGMVQAYYANLEGCSGRFYSVHGGWKTTAKDCDCNIVCSKESVTTIVEVDNCHYSGEFASNKFGVNFVGRGCTFTNLIPTDKHRNFVANITEYSTTRSHHIVGALVGQINIHLEKTFNNITQLETSEGTSLDMDISLSDQTRHSAYGALMATGDCYGIRINAPIRANGYTLHGCEFTLDREIPFPSGPEFSGTMEGCKFNVVRGGIKISKAAVVTFRNCEIHNGACDLFDALGSGSVLTFENCTIEDISRIYSWSNNVTINIY